jgi:UDP:flavonoid glycosyltransferase YjiC (YdhE family)
MRILLTCVSGYSHVYNMVPLAVAARRLGHQVALSAPHEMAPVAERAGIPLLPSGPGRLRLRTEMIRRYADEMPRDLRDWRTGARIFGDLAPRLRFDPLRAVLRDFRPHLVVSESLELTGPLVAEMEGIPHVFHSIGPFHADSMGLVWERAQAFYREHLGSEVGPETVLEPYLDVWPRALQADTLRSIRRSIPIRLAAYHGGGPAGPDAAPAPSPDADPRVLITFGTVSNAAVDDVVESARALGRAGLETLVTLGPRGWFDFSRGLPAATSDGPARTPIGPRAAAVDYIPLDAELPRTDVLVHHGGGNTMRAALEYGIPSVVIPQAAEQVRNADRIAACGLGLMLEPAQADPDRIVTAVSLALSDRGIRDRVAAARAAWHAMPPPEVAMNQLAGLIAGPAPVNLATS